MYIAEHLFFPPLYFLIYLSFLFFDLFFTQLITPQLLLLHVLFQIHNDTSLFHHLESPLLSMFQPRIISPFILYLLQKPILQDIHLFRPPLHLLLPLYLHLLIMFLLCLPLDFQNLLSFPACVVDFLEDPRLFRLQECDSILQ